MSIPETQLDTWSHQGSITQSASTYQAVRNTLDSEESKYHSRDYDIFLQGSYGNATNISKESDVDLVIRLNSCFHGDAASLPQVERTQYDNSYTAAQYGLDQFRAQVISHLQDAYGDDVKIGPKAVKIQANGGRRSCDVIIATEHRRYSSCKPDDERFVSGISFKALDGTRINNFPKQHAANAVAKHKSTSGWFKPTARILKNLRRFMVDAKTIDKGLAPSYYLEGLLYNVPDHLFGDNYTDTVAKCINWLQQADGSQFVCMNELYYLLREGSPVTWRAESCEQFLDAAIKTWNEW